MVQSWGSCMLFEFYGFCRATILVEGTEAIRGLLKLQQNSEVAAVVDVFVKLMALMFLCPSLMMEFF